MVAENIRNLQHPIMAAAAAGGWSLAGVGRCMILPASCAACQQVDGFDVRIMLGAWSVKPSPQLDPSA
jgi:hypothetical protein